MYLKSFFDKRGIRVKNIMFLILLFMVFWGFFSNVLYTKAIKVDADEQREALLETAYAYYRQGEQLQYDSYRKNLFSTPEDATSQHYGYTVCSGFTFQVYYQALGIEIPDTTEELLNYAEANKSNKSNILFYYGSSDEIYSEKVLGTSALSNYSNLIDDWIDIVKPGDILVVTGHAMLIENVDYDARTITIMEATNGTRYDYVNHIDLYEKIGTVKYTDLNYRLKSYYTPINNNGTLIEEMALIRIITDGNSYINSKNQSDTYDGITSSAQSRLKYPQIDIEKTVKIIDDIDVDSQNMLVNIGEYLTYEIVIKNNSDKNYSDFNILEDIDSRLLIHDKGNGVFENNQLKWSVSSLEAGNSVMIKYTVKVPNEKSLLGKTIISTGKVDNIATSKIETLIGNKLSDEQTDRILSSFDDLKNNSLVEREFINSVYSAALGVDLGLTDLNNLDIISYDETVTSYGGEVLSVKITRLNDTAIKKYVYNNFYGLRIAERNNESQSVVGATLQWNIYPAFEVNDRARTLTFDMLLDGDIVLAYVGNESTTDRNLVNKSYIYLNNKLVRKVSPNNFEELSGEELTNFLRNLIGENYIILRPSIGLITEDGGNTNNDNPVIDSDNENDVIDNNVQTGNVSIIIVLIIGVVTLIFSMHYFEKNKI